MSFDGLMEEKEVKKNRFSEISHPKTQGWGGGKISQRWHSEGGKQGTNV